MTDIMHDAGDTLRTKDFFVGGLHAHDSIHYLIRPLRDACIASTRGARSTHKAISIDGCASRPQFSC